MNMGDLYLHLRFETRQHNVVTPITVGQYQYLLKH